MSRPTVESFRYGSVPGDGPFLPRSSSYTRPSQPQQPPQLLDNAGETFQTLADFILSLPHPRYWPGLLISFFLLDPLRSLATTFIGLVTSPRTHRVVLRLSILASLFYAALILAILAYVGFYQAWVPDVGRMEELYLQYGQAGEVPYAEVDLARWRGLGRSAVGDDWFAEEQEYDVNVELLVPISAANLDLGNFMVSIDLLTNDNVVVFRSSRPTILRPTMPPMRFLSQVAAQFSARPSLAGSQFLPLPFTSPSLEVMNVKLFDRLVLHPSPGSVPFSNPSGSPLEAGTRSRRITKAIVRVGRHDSDKYWTYGGGHGVGGVVVSSGSQAGGRDANGMMLATQSGGSFRSRGELQTVSAGLRFDARLKGLRYFLYSHPILSFVVFTSLFLSFELLSALTLWTIAAVYTSTLPGLDVDLRADTQFVPYAGDRTNEDGNRRRRAERSGSGNLFSPEDSDADTITAGEGDDDDNGANVNRSQAQARSLASLRARDQAEAREAQTAAEEQARRSGRLMTGGDIGALGTDTPESLLTPTYGRRVLGRLDEETEEETDDLGSSGSATGTTLSAAERDVPAAAGGSRRARQTTVATASPSSVSRESSLEGSEESSEQGISGTSQGREILIPEASDTPAASAQEREGFRRRKAFDDGDDGDDASSGLVGGSATDPSVLASGSVRSFGATTEASRRTGDTAAGGSERRGTTE